LEATAIQVLLIVKPVIILATYHLPSRPLRRSDPIACFGKGMPVLMAGDFNTKYVDLSWRLNTRRGYSYVFLSTRTPV